MTAKLESGPMTRRFFAIVSMGVTLAAVSPAAAPAAFSAHDPQRPVASGSPAVPPPVANPQAPAPPVPTTASVSADASGGVPTPPDYVIGPDDVLSIVYWRDKDMTGDVTVRPDGKISLPLLHDIQAAGLTPDQLRGRLTEESRRYIEDPNVTVVVHQIHSRKVFITGEVGKPGTYPLTESTTVLQLIALAGGLRDYANGKRIVIVRTENGRPVSYPFNYKEVVSRKNLRQNIELKPGDTVIVP
jgi:polysaccharide export outer membrane protein